MAGHDGAAGGSSSMISPVVTGGCSLLILFGVVTLVMDSIFGVEIVPPSVPGAVALIAGLVVGGSLLGALVGMRRR